MNGGEGDDFVDGGTDNDRLTDYYGHDTLEGGQGNDYLTSGSGSDLLKGGEGNDYYYFRSAYNMDNDGATVINDIQGESDLLVFYDVDSMDATFSAVSNNDNGLVDDLMIELSDTFQVVVEDYFNPGLDASGAGLIETVYFYHENDLGYYVGESMNFDDISAMLVA